MTKIDHAQLRDVVTVFHVIEAVQELYGDQAADKVTGRAIERAGCMLPGSAPVVASPAPEVPEGWKLVPATATREWAYSYANWRQGQSSTPRCEPPGGADVARAGDLIAGMLAASPPAPVASHEPASVSGKPAIFVSAEQLDNAAELPSTYLPFRLAPEGKFQTPLYRAAPPAKAEVSEGLKEITANYLAGLFGEAVAPRHREWADELISRILPAIAPPPEPAKAEVDAALNELERLVYGGVFESGASLARAIKVVRIALAAPPTAPVVAHEDNVWLLYFHDTDVRPEIYTGQGAEAAAYANWDKSQINWSSDLFKRVVKDGDFDARSYIAAAPAAARSAAEKMRERCAREVEGWKALAYPEILAEMIRALPLPGGEA